MHSFWYRANALLTLAATCAAVMSILTSTTDFLQTKQVNVDVKLLSVDMLRRDRNGNDMAVMSMSLDADLRELFSWNTKMVFLWVEARYSTRTNSVNRLFLWDKIITKKEAAKLELPQLRQKYPMTDQGKNLRGKEFNLTVSWNIIPRTGALRTQSLTFPGGKLPGEYMTAASFGSEAQGRS